MRCVVEREDGKQCNGWGIGGGRRQDKRRWKVGERERKGKRDKY